MLESFQSWYRDLPDKKRYLEFISAFLSIPVLVTVVVLNLRSLNARNESIQLPPAPTQVIIREIVVPAVNEVTTTPLPSASPTLTPSATPTPSLTPTPTTESSPSAVLE